MDFREEARRLASLAEIEARIEATVSAIMENALLAWPGDHQFREEDRERLEGVLAELLRQRAEFNPSEPPVVFDSLSHLAPNRRSDP